MMSENILSLLNSDFLNNFFALILVVNFIILIFFVSYDINRMGDDD